MGMIVLSIVGGFLALCVLISIIGLFLPRDHLNARAVVLAKPRDEVWRTLTDLDGQRAWRRGLEKIEHLPAVDGKPSFREHTGQGAIVYVVDADQAPALRITRIDDKGMPFGGRWIYELEPAGDGTRLAITEDGFVRNPAFRFLWKTVIPQGRTIEKFMQDLGKHLGVAAVPEPAPPSKLAD